MDLIVLGLLAIFSSKIMPKSPSPSSSSHHSNIWYVVAVVGAADVSYLRLSARILFSQYTTLGILYFVSLSLNFVNCQFLIEGFQTLWIVWTHLWCCVCISATAKKTEIKFIAIKTKTSVTRKAKANFDDKLSVRLLLTATFLFPLFRISLLSLMSFLFGQNFWPKGYWYLWQNVDGYGKWRDGKYFKPLQIGQFLGVLSLLKFHKLDTGPH